MSVTLHEGTTFLISKDSGDLAPGEGRGLFHQDTRFLRRLEVLLDGQAPVVLTSRVLRPPEGVHFLEHVDCAAVVTVRMLSRFS